MKPVVFIPEAEQEMLETARYYEFQASGLGRVGYFYFKNCSRDLQQLNEYLKERVRIYLRRKHRKVRKYKAYPNRYLYETLGLYKIQTTARWTQTAKASGRR